MKSVTFRRILAVLAALAVLLPAAALADWTVPDPLSCETPWWEMYPPAPKPKPKTRVVYRQAETLVSSTPAEGWAYTSIKSVNVRVQPSTYAAKAATVRSKGTEIAVTARVKNSSGEIWYAVELQSGTLGYIRSDLLDTSMVTLFDETAPVPAAAPVPTPMPYVYPAEPTPQVIYITAEPKPTPTPILIILPAAAQEDRSETMTPEIIFVTPEPPQNEGDG